MTPVTSNALWYTRRDGTVRGPFPCGQLTRYVLLGRVLPGDEVSRNRKDWCPLAQIPELMPECMVGGSPPDPQQVLLARRAADERAASDRRQAVTDVASVASERRSGDRRRPESTEVLHHREVREKVLQPVGTESESYVVPVLVGLAFSVLLALLMSRAPRPAPEGAQCDAPPAPGVNWTNCHLEGAAYTSADLRAADLRNASLAGARLRGTRLNEAQLSYADLALADLSYSDLRRSHLVGAALRAADLSYADLRDADLSYADLAGAKLGAADLTGARLDNAIWPDRRICAPGSVGRCLTSPP